MATNVGWRPIARNLGGGGTVDGEDAPSKAVLLAHAALDKPLGNGWSLYAHQKEAVRQIIEQRRVILAFDMGLGKTLISLVAARAFQRTTRCRVEVLCPVSMADSWRREALAIGVTLTVHSWGKIPAPDADSRGGRFMLICDEAHYMQNPKARRTKAALELANAACVLILATGPSPANGPRATGAGVEQTLLVQVHR
eukprot:SAG11_NODE_2539_length_3242_cov_3.190900_3_plen_197_part_00